MRLNQVKQCAKCPWRVDVDPHDIPNGYCQTKHKKLETTIARNGEFMTRGAMACHESPVGGEDYCIGWLANQLGVGNNIYLRLLAFKIENIRDIELIGEQHERFEDTLPQTLQDE